jgi:hypothetical protein
MGSWFSRVLWYQREFGSPPPVLGFPQCVKRLLWISAIFLWKRPASHVEPKNALNMVSWPAWMFSSVRKHARESWSPPWNYKHSEELGILLSLSSLLIASSTSAFQWWMTHQSSRPVMGGGLTCAILSSCWLLVAGPWVSLRTSEIHHRHSLWWCKELWIWGVFWNLFALVVCEECLSV